MKIGIVSIKKLGPDHFLLRYSDPTSGRDVKRRVRMPVADVRRMAAHLSERAHADAGLIPRTAETAGVPTIARGIELALAVARATDTTTKERRRWAGKFEAWLGAAHPAVWRWSDMRPSILQEYQRRVETTPTTHGRPPSYDTLRLALAPVRLAWRYAAENWPDWVRPVPQVRLPRRPRPAVECLEADEVRDLLEWMEKRAPDVTAIATLQALAGLRMLEAASLRLQDVDLKAGTITITETGLHRPKTPESWRSLPLAGPALDVVRAAVDAAARRAKDPDGQPPPQELFLNADGQPWNKDAISHRMTTAIRQAAAAPGEMMRRHGKRLTLNPHGLSRPELARVPARKLRASFATMAARWGASDRLIKAYMGHAPGDILGAHYRAVRIEDLRQVAAAIDRNWPPEATPAGTKPEHLGPAKSQSAQKTGLGAPEKS